MSSSTIRTYRTLSRAALGAALFALAGCTKDYGVPSGIKGGEEVFQPGCYVNPNQAAPNDGAAVITLDASQRFQTMQGFGTSMRLFDDPLVTNSVDPVTKRGIAIPPASEQSSILDQLYIDLGLTRVRIFPGDGGGIETVNDNGNPLVADLSKFDFSWTRGDGQIALMPELVRRGVKTYFSSTRALESWMTDSNPDEYAEWVLVMLHHWRDRGMEMPYVSLKNEPGNAASGGVWSGEFLRDVTKILGARIKAEGLSTKIVVPDDVSPKEAYARLQIILADPVARQYVGAIGYHLSERGGEDKIKQLGEQYGIPIWMTEHATGDDWLDWAKTMHELIADDGVSAIDYRWGFFGDQSSSQLVQLVVSGGSYARSIRMQQYYVMGQYSRFVRPGAVRIGATSSDPNVKATAYIDGTKVIVVASYLPPPELFFERQVRVELGTGGPCVHRADRVRTSTSDRWLSLGSLTVTAPRFSTALPARSVTTFVGQE
ncbi:MAG: hypothetical protein JWL95_2408 [Gemmatimonadetes bacterium]|nr:hypothetical protein [Gemmatimonadota bacterium]